MRTKIFHDVKENKFFRLSFSVVSLVLVSKCAASGDSSMVEVLYGVCDAEKLIYKLVETPKSPVFPENNFLSDTVFLRYERSEENWILDQSVSDIEKKYTRQAIWLVENNLLINKSDPECLDFYVKFNFSDRR